MKAFQRAALLFVLPAMLLALGACNRADQRSAAQRAEAVKTQDVAPASKREDDSASAADGTRAMGAGAAERLDDGTITARVNVALAADQDLSAVTIDVDTRNGVVTLSGPVPTATVKERASEVARTVKGVASVNNQLTLKIS